MGEVGVVGDGSPVAYLTFPGLARVGVAMVTTTRHCPGLRAWSEVETPFDAEARAALAPSGLNLERVAWVRQVHGADVARAWGAGGYAGVADVMVTTARGVALSIFTADCLAITLADPAAGVLAMAHVGWRGAARGATEAAVAAATAAGARPARLHAAIGPSIGPCCYEVDDPVVAQFSAAYPALFETWLAPRRPGHWMLDLWAVSEDLLVRAGIDRARVENPRLCTACQPELFYSYRKGHRGRLASIAELPERRAGARPPGPGLQATC
jgi:YfiH family protein